MTSGGIVRRIDELGRIVIPKELRKTMRLKVGDEMEILSTSEGLTLKKFNAYDGFKNLASSVAKSLAGLLDFHHKRDGAHKHTVSLSHPRIVTSVIDGGISHLLLAQHP